ncbi:CbrC family protein [Streptomyces paradoxus]|uniref:CbrC family protein n=1 Tax=Streptomyces paradoxus TaxID=66375 RepID=UPI0037013A7A
MGSVDMPTGGQIGEPAMSAGVPFFRYHPDPLASGSIRAAADTCACCKRNTGWIYTAAFYTSLSTSWPTWTTGRPPCSSAAPRAAPISPTPTHPRSRLLGRVVGSR